MTWFGGYFKGKSLLFLKVTGRSIQLCCCFLGKHKHVLFQPELGRICLSSPSLPLQHACGLKSCEPSGQPGVWSIAPCCRVLGWQQRRRDGSSASSGGEPQQMRAVNREKLALSGSSGFTHAKHQLVKIVSPGYLLRLQCVKQRWSRSSKAWSWIAVCRSREWR